MLGVCSGSEFGDAAVGLLSDEAKIGVVSDVWKVVGMRGVGIGEGGNIGVGFGEGRNVGVGVGEGGNVGVGVGAGNGVLQPSVVGRILPSGLRIERITSWNE